MKIWLANEICATLIKIRQIKDQKNVEEGKYADMLLVDENLVDDVGVIKDDHKEVF